LAEPLKGESKVDNIRTPEQFFDAMNPGTRTRLENRLKMLAWKWATATACGYKMDGTRLFSVGTEDAMNLQRDLGNAALEVFVDKRSG
jgi:hypothetical protein